RSIVAKKDVAGYGAKLSNFTFTSAVSSRLQNRLLCTLFGILILGSSPTFSQDFDGAAYLEEVFDLIERHSIRRDSVDLAMLKDSALYQVQGATEPSACYPAIQWTLRSLGDRHSFLMPAERATEWKRPKTENAQGPPPDFFTFSGKRLGDYGYVQMRSFGSGNRQDNNRYADSLHNLLRSLATPEVKGWILDLRRNGGGNCWPMLAGIGPLLGHGTCGYFLDANQRKIAWSYKKGSSRARKTKICKVSGKPFPLQEELPVAVLWGPGTASSGEIVAVAFIGREKMKSFGQPSYGLTTGNGTFTLSDGAKVFLTSSIYVDRNGQPYGGKLEPDVMVEPNEAGGEDLALFEAQAWLEQQP
ncbi:MAG: S41 family peptidase, partial [Bacteroidota bacterium]